MSAGSAFMHAKFDSATSSAPRKIPSGRHLALFISDLGGGGAQRRTVTLANAFAARGHRVDLVVIRARGPSRRDLSLQVNLVALEPWWTRLPGLTRSGLRWPLGAVPALAGYLRRERPEVLLSAASHVDRAAPLACRLAGAPTKLVLRVSNHPAPAASTLLQHSVKRWLSHRLYRWADELIAVSDGVAKQLVRETGIPTDSIFMVANPVVSDELYCRIEAPIDHRWLRPGSPPVILGAGKLSRRKDFATLLKAFARVHQAREARLIVLGRGPEGARLTRLARHLEISADVDLPGFVPNPLPYMARSAVFVLSSSAEGLPSVLIEAMACGCPVVSTDCPYGPGEILDRGAYGRLVPVGDDAAMAEAILATLDDPPERDHLRRRAAEFSVDRAADRYLEVMLGGKPSEVEPDGSGQLPKPTGR